MYEPILSPEQIRQLPASPAQEQFDGDAAKFRLGVEAKRLDLTYEYDPYFSLSIARVDPLPHQLEAVYDYFIKLPHIRFLVADDPGMGRSCLVSPCLRRQRPQVRRRVETECCFPNQRAGANPARTPEGQHKRRGMSGRRRLEACSPDSVCGSPP